MYLAPLTLQNAISPKLQTNLRKYETFHSRWPEKAGFEAWVTHSEIAYAVADNPLGPFHHVATVWTCRDGAASWDSDVVHNPAILRHGNRYYLYYMGTRGPDFDLDQPADEATWWTYRNNQRIDVAMADHPAGPWTREEGRVTADKTITLPEHVLKSTRDEGSRLVLQWDAMRCPALNITVNDESTTTILWGAHQLDLIDEIKEGPLLLQIELLKSGRNTFGPHHHLKGEVTFFGLTSFTDKIGWVDAGADEIWTDRYCLVSCGVTGLQLVLVR